MQYLEQGHDELQADITLMIQNNTGLNIYHTIIIFFLAPCCNDLNNKCLIRLFWSLWTWRSCHLYLSIGKTQWQWESGLTVYQDCHYTFKSSEGSLVMKEMLIVGYQIDSKFSNHHNRSAAFLLLMCGLLRGVGGVFICCHKDWTSTENYLQNTFKPCFIISTYTVLSLLLSFTDDVSKLP